MSFSEDIWSTLYIYIHIVGEIRWYLAYLSKEGKLPLFFKLKALLRCPFIFPRWHKKPTWYLVRVEGLIEWWSSQREMRSHLHSGVGSTQTWQLVFWEPRNKGWDTALQNQVVGGACSYLCSPVLADVLPRACSLASAEAGMGQSVPSLLALEEGIWVSSCS